MSPVSSVKFVVRIDCNEGSPAWKVFDRERDGGQWFLVASLLLDADVFDAPEAGLDARQRARAEQILGCEGRAVTRVELHCSTANDPRQAVERVERGDGELLGWRDVDHPFGDLSDLLGDLLADEHEPSEED